MHLSGIRGVFHASRIQNSMKAAMCRLPEVSFSGFSYLCNENEHLDIACHQRPAVSVMQIVIIVG